MDNFDIDEDDEPTVEDHHSEIKSLADQLKSKPDDYHLAWKLLELVACVYKRTPEGIAQHKKDRRIIIRTECPLCWECTHC